MAADYTKIYRLLRLLLLMQQNRADSVESLAAELDVTERTVYRDLSVLRELGVLCEFDKDVGGYRVRRDFFLPPIHLTTHESLALLLLGQAARDQDQIAMTGPAARAVEKIRGQLPPAVLRELGDVDQHLDVTLPPTGPAVEAVRDVFEKVRDAIRRRRTLRCRYESPNADTNGDEFLLQPYVLTFDQRAWYVVGRHGGHGEVRRLKLNRFSAIAPTDKPYAIPDDFSLAEYRGKAWRMIRGERTYRAVVEFDAVVAENVDDTNWHPAQQIDNHADGSLTFHCEVDGLDEIVWWILGYGPHARVREPAELVEKVAALAKATTERYARP